MPNLTVNNIPSKDSNSISQVYTCQRGCWLLLKCQQSSHQTKTKSFLPPNNKIISSFTSHSGKHRSLWHVSKPSINPSRIQTLNIKENPTKCNLSQPLAAVTISPRPVAILDKNMKTFFFLSLYLSDPTPPLFDTWNIFPVQLKQLVTEVQVKNKANNLQSFQSINKTKHYRYKNNNYLMMTALMNETSPYSNHVATNWPSR